MSFGVVSYELDYELGLCFCGEDSLDKMKRYGLETVMLSLLSSHLCCGNFLKHSERFGRIMEVEIWQSKMHTLDIDKLYLHMLLTHPLRVTAVA